MIKIENVEVSGWKPAIRGMRNPMNSWDKSDTNIYAMGYPAIGDNDLKLMQQLARQGSVHGKYLRMINVTCDITAPLYWWKEFDTYRAGVTPNPMDIETNSCSTMHKIHAKEFTLDDFSHEQLYVGAKETLCKVIDRLNYWRNEFLESRLKEDWWQMIQLLPSSYNQKRTVQLNYEVLRNICTYRSNHKLDEWVEFCKWAKSLPYFNEIFGDDKTYENKYTILKTEEYEEMVELIRTFKKV